MVNIWKDSVWRLYFSSSRSDFGLVILRSVALSSIFKILQSVCWGLLVPPAVNLPVCPGPVLSSGLTLICASIQKDVVATAGRLCFYQICR